MQQFITFAYIYLCKQNHPRMEKMDHGSIPINGNLSLDVLQYIDYIF